MPAALREAVEERLTLRTVASWALLGAVLRLVFGAPPAQIAMMAVFGAAFGLVHVAEEVYDVRSAIGHGLLGTLSFGGGAAMLAFGAGASPLSAAFVLVGAWFVLDAVQTARHEGLTETEPDGREVYRDYLARRVHELLKARARTRRELHTEFDADDGDVDAVVAHLRERGLVEARGSELRVPATDDGTLGRVREGLAGFVRRLARPLTLEFETDGSQGPRDRSASTPGPGTADERAAGAESARGGSRRIDGSESEAAAGRRTDDRESDRETAGGRRTDDREPESEAAESG